MAPSKIVAERVLGRRPGVLSVEANPVSQTATITYDPQLTDLSRLRDWARECGYHCSGQSVPHHVCDPGRSSGTPAPGPSPSCAPPASAMSPGTAP